MLSQPQTCRQLQMWAKCTCPLPGGRQATLAGLPLSAPYRTKARRGRRWVGFEWQPFLKPLYSSPAPIVQLFESLEGRQVDQGCRLVPPQSVVFGAMCPTKLCHCSLGSWVASVDCCLPSSLLLEAPALIGLTNALAPLS